MHVCVDMQRLFAEPSQWATPWITRVLPRIERLVERRAPQTVFTRFLPAAKPGQGVGTWKRYYDRWASMTIDTIGPEMVELLPALAG
ncbi:MAG: cysteine hydrolase, partial [Mesorhizobium sp.]